MCYLIESVSIDKQFLKLKLEEAIEVEVLKGYQDADLNPQGLFQEQKKCHLGCKL